MVGHSFACLFTFRDGKVSQVKEYATREDALEAAGLRE
jgi:ketosteroid isomerase-like protein